MVCVSVIASLALLFCRRPWSSTCCRFVPIETTITMDVTRQALMSQDITSFIFQLFFLQTQIASECIHLSDPDSENWQWVSRDPLGDDLFRRHPEVVHKLCTGLSVNWCCVYRTFVNTTSIYIFYTFIFDIYNMKHQPLARLLKSAFKDNRNWPGKSSGQTKA